MELSSLQREIIAFMSCQLDSPLNTTGAGEPAWDNFMLGVAAGDDPIFERFKEVAGEAHFTPLELFRLAFPNVSACADELSVLCWVLPQRAEARRGNAERRGLPSEAWGRVKQFGEAFYNAMGKNLEEFFGGKGIPAVFPMGRPDLVKRVASDKFFIASNWSERHACFAAGLGTFGLCDGLITPLGKAHRCGSIVVKAQLPATPREYADPHEYCPWFMKHSCGLCAKRCPTGAISAEGHDKKACQEYLHGACADFFDGLGLKTYACGLCQTGVPCEDRIPGRQRPDIYRTFLG